MKKLLLILSVLALLIIAGCSTNKITGSIVGKMEDTMVIPISDLSTTAKFFTYESASVNVKYFAVLGSDGKPRVAFDACDVCGGFKGYEQVGTDIRCINCGKVFRIDELGEKNKGSGCWPSHLEHQIQGNNIIIKKSDLDAGVHGFVR